jgi:hypothetical protein
VTVGVLVGATGGYVVYRTSPDPQERSRVSVESGSDQHLANLSNQIQSRRSLDAQSARWQAQADAYLAEQQAHLDGQAKTHGATASTNPIDVGDQAAKAERFDRKENSSISDGPRPNSRQRRFVLVRSSWMLRTIDPTRNPRLPIAIAAASSIIHSPVLMSRPPDVGPRRRTRT